jgi:hypothetical protein
MHDICRIKNMRVMNIVENYNKKVLYKIYSKHDISI